jgi:hypothetical protein
VTTWEVVNHVLHDVEHPGKSLIIGLLSLHKRKQATRGIIAEGVAPVRALLFMQDVASNT